MGPVRAGLHRLACETAGLLSLTALGLCALYVASNSALAALGVAVSLVPGCLLTSCECSRLAELKRRAPGLPAHPTLVEQAAQSGRAGLPATLPRL